MFKRVTLSCAALAVLFIAGCGKAPVAEMNQATTAMQAAQSAEADQYAPDAYKMAQDTLDAANAAKAKQDSSFALFRTYVKAKALYTSAQVLADKAKADAQTEKERIREQVTQMIDEAQQAVTDANSALSRAPRRIRNKFDVNQMKDDLATASSTFDQAKSDFDAGKYLAAKSELEMVKAKADSISTEINTASSR